MNELILSNANIITMDENKPFIQKGCIHIAGHIIAKISSGKNYKKNPKTKVIDLNGNFVLPGLINAHAHLYSSLARGMPVSGSPKNFCQILDKIWWKLDKLLNHEEIFYSALIGLLDSIKCGVTTVIDHHASPNAVTGSLDLITEAAQKLGIRTCLCYEVSDRDGPEIAKLGIKENIEFAKKAENEKNPILSSLFGLHASFTLSNKTLKKCIEENALQIPYHIHAAEDKFDLLDSLKKYKKTVIERLAGFGILSKNSIAAHCIHVNLNDIKILKKTGSFIAHNPQSNMNNAVGYAKIPEMLEENITAGLGTDGYTSNMLQEIKALPLLHKFATGNPNVMNFNQIFNISFKNNAEIASACFNQRLGKIKEGYQADLLILNYKAPTPFNKDNFLGHIIFGINTSNVESVIINGKFVLKDKKITGIDEKKIIKKSKEIARKLWKKL